MPPEAVPPEHPTPPGKQPHPLPDGHADDLTSLSDRPAAAVPDGDAVTPTGPRMLVLRIGDREYALPVDAVLEVIEAPPVTRVPLSPRAVAGVASVRGEIIPVVDMGIRLHGTAIENARRVVIVETPGGRVGLLADDVVGMLQAQSEDAIGAVPADAAEELPEGIAAGLYPHTEDRVIMVLRLDQVLVVDDSEEEL